MRQRPSMHCGRNARAAASAAPEQRADLHDTVDAVGEVQAEQRPGLPGIAAVRVRKAAEDRRAQRVCSCRSARRSDISTRAAANVLDAPLACRSRVLATTRRSSPRRRSLSTVAPSAAWTTLVSAMPVEAVCVSIRLPVKPVR